MAPGGAMTGDETTERVRMASAMRVGFPATLKKIGMAATAAAVIAAGGVAAAAMVSGTLIGADGGPQTGREVHFEERLSHDIYIATTGNGGAFSANLPEGVYDLRSETGPIIDGGIAVGGNEVALGKVRDTSAGNLMRFFQTQEVGEAIVKSQAPSTADVPSKDEAIAAEVTPAAPVPSPAAAPSVAGN